MSARPPLLTSLGATTLLAALWFVPSANATPPGSAGPASAASASAAPASGNGGSGTVTLTADGAGTAGAGDAADAGGTPPGARAATLALADTGGIDTTPYLLAGTLFLGVGAGFVAFSVRRTRAL
ncbi:LPXTG cell wall anchor domain-containing protein [Streptomyces sp. NPDC007369]|uniref:LPXTG cell wall anchor domain-containing protein n=1 Tax=Streptomyces sp. NPDC007369 TaxID=3154589 RepID=UPI00340D319C